MEILRVIFTGKHFIRLESLQSFLLCGREEWGWGGGGGVEIPNEMKHSVLETTAYSGFGYSQ